MAVRATCVLALLSAGCLTEVKLGDIPPDAALSVGDAAAEDATSPRDAAARDAVAADAEPSPSPDAGDGDAGPFDAGAGAEPYTMQFYNAPPESMPVMCTDDLAGTEMNYAQLTPADCGLEDGPVFLTRQSQHVWILSGSLVRQDFGAATIRLVEGLDPNAPPGAMVAQMTYNIPGPNGTTRQAEVIALDRDTATTTSADGLAGVELSLGSSVGSCFITFGMSVTR